MNTRTFFWVLASIVCLTASMWLQVQAHQLRPSGLGLAQALQGAACLGLGLLFVFYAVLESAAMRASRPGLNT